MLLDAARFCSVAAPMVATGRMTHKVMMSTGTPGLLFARRESLLASDRRSIRISGKIPPSA
jgi:hypothetical protein